VAYKNNIPQPGDKKNISQADLLNNFAAIKTLVDTNHETFGAGNEGKHLKADLTNQTAAPPTSAANEVTLYSNNGELCLSKGGGAEIDFTTITHAGNQGHTLLPSGLKMIWDTFTLTPGAGAGHTTYTSTFAGGVTLTTLYNLTYSAFNNGAVSVRDVAFTYTTTGAPITALNFTRDLGGATVKFSYLSIGV
jgi:hypothetical protein